MPQSAKSTGKMPPRAAVLFFCVVAGSRAAALSCSFRCSNRRSCSLLSSWSMSPWQKRPVWYLQAERGDNIEEFGILFGQHVRFDTRLMARTEVWYPRSTHTAFVTWAFFGRWGSNRRSWQKAGYQIAQFADLGAKKALGDTKPRDSARSPGRAGTKPRDSARGSHLKGAKPRDSVCGVASRGGQTCDLDVRPRPEASVREM